MDIFDKLQTLPPDVALFVASHSDKRRDKARTIAHESGISVRQAYRRLRNIEVSAENENFDYEAETPKG